MNYLKINGEPVSVFDICQAHAQLESDYNNGGWLRERPSNQRRMESTSCQLARLEYDGRGRWVDVCAVPGETDDCGDEDVRFIYLSSVLKWSLPADAEMLAAINRTFTREFLENYPAYLLEQK